MEESKRTMTDKDMPEEARVATPESLKRKNLRHNYKWAVTDGVLAYVSAGMVPPFISIMALTYGANAIGLSMINLLPSLVNTLLFLPFAGIAERSKSVKRLVLLSGYLTRSVFLAMAFIPFMPQGWKADLVIALNALQAVPSVLYLIVWTDMMGASFPQSEWGVVFSRRNALANLASVIGTVAAGYLIDWLPGEWGYFAIFAISGITGMLSIYALQHIKEVPSPKAETRSISVFKRLAMPFRDKKLGRRFAYFSAGLFLYNLGIYLSAPAFPMFYVKELGLTKSMISLLNTAGTLFVVLTSPFWGRLSRKRGNAIVFAYSTIWQALFPYFYYISGKDLGMMFAWQAILGFGVAGYNLSMFNLGLEYVDETERPNGIAVTNTVIFMSGIIGSLIGGPLMQMKGIGATFLVSTVIRVFGWAVFLAVFEPSKIMGKVFNKRESKQTVAKSVKNTGDKS